MLTQALANGAISGLGLALVALGFSLVYLSCRVFHIALGAVYTVTPYVALAGLGAGWPWPLAVAVSVLAALGLSVTCESGNHRWLEQRRAASGVHLIASLGIYIVVVQAVAVYWGNDGQALRAGVDQTFQLSGSSLILTRSQVIAAAIPMVMLSAFYAWLRFTRVGLRFRALADNATEFGLLGYNVFAYRRLAFALSGLLVSAAALIAAYDVGFDPHGGLPMFLLAVVAVIIGGRGSLAGPVAGGLILGVVRSQVAWHYSARWQDTITFLLLAVFLYARPEGLFSKDTRLEAEQ